MPIPGAEIDLRAEHGADRTKIPLTALSRYANSNTVGAGLPDLDDVHFICAGEGTHVSSIRRHDVDNVAANAPERLDGKVQAIRYPHR